MRITYKWNEIEPTDSLESNILSLGKHINKILDVSNYTSKDNKPCLRIIFDIEEGSKYDGYCQKLLDSRKTDDKRWPNEGTKYIPVEEKYQGYLKYFIEVLQKSNHTFLDIAPGEELDLEQFKGLKFGGAFGLQEYENKDGEIKTSITLISFKEIDKVNEITIPDVRLVDGSYISYEEYMKTKKGVGKQEPIQGQMDLEDSNHEIYELDVESSEYPF